MSVYTVHEPPPRRFEAAADPQRFVFVRDGFSLWAFLFAPLWMLRYRLWLVLAIYIALAVIFTVLQQLVGVPTGAAAVLGFFVSLLIGLEAGTLRRFGLARRGWKDVGVISANGLEAAERRFFDSWVEDAALPRDTPPRDGPPRVNATTPTGPRVPPSHPIGLFPEPGANG